MLTGTGLGAGEAAGRRWCWTHVQWCVAQTRMLPLPTLLLLSSVYCLGPCHATTIFLFFAHNFAYNTEPPTQMRFKETVTSCASAQVDDGHGYGWVAPSVTTCLCL